MITGANWIGNKSSKTGKKTFSSFDPQKNAPTDWVFYEATEEEVHEAATLAHGAVDTYTKIPGAKRAAFLRAIAHEIEALGDPLVQAYCTESGLPEARAHGERGRTVGQFRLFASLLEEGSWVNAVIERADPDRKPLPKADIRSMLMPLGPVAVFGASNFPLAYSTAGGDTASALAAGCPVIVKGHPMHPATGELVAGAVLRAAESTGMPNGVFSNLNSSDSAVGQQLVDHPLVKAVGFTGSRAGGVALYRLAAQRKEPIPVFAEMGSINPVVMLPSALREEGDAWAIKYAGSITLGAGQFCTNPGLLLALKSTTLDAFISRLTKEVAQTVPVCMLHPNIYKNYEERKKEVSAQGGVTVAASYNNATGNNKAHPAILTVTGANFMRNPRLHQEVFGPLSIIVRCEDAQQLETIVKHMEGQLTGTVLGSPGELEKYAGVIEALQKKVGRILYNGVPTGVEVNTSMVHGGPFPATTDARYTAVGTAAIKRWVRPMAFQNWPNALLPDALKEENPLGILRLVEGKMTRK